MIINRRKIVPEKPGTSRTREVFTLEPGHQARIPILLHPTPSYQMYGVESNTPLHEVYVARSVVNTHSDNHFAMVSNFGTIPVKTPAGTRISSTVIVKDSLSASAHVNNPSLDDSDAKDFEKMSGLWISIPSLPTSKRRTCAKSSDDSTVPLPTENVSLVTPTSAP